MKKVLSVAALAVALTGSALAADLPRYKAPPPPPLPPPPLWTGFYVGLNAGGTWGNNNNIRTAAAPIFDVVPNGLSVPSSFLANFVGSSNSSGFIGGGQLGYNWQFMNSFVGGVEADIQGIARSGGNNTLFSAVQALPTFPAGTVTQIATVNKSLDYVGTVRGRLGWLFTPTLLAYGTGGLAYGGVNMSTTLFQVNVPNFGASSVQGSTGNFSDTRVGWTVGGGLEWMFMPNWSLKAEYLYYDLGTVSYSLTPLTNVTAVLNFASVAQSTARFNGNIVRAGVNYHFNWGAPPVVAKY
jgi:outer membrane immunogenic protein